MPSLNQASDIVGQDLSRLSERLDDVFRSMSGANLLITGGAGFLGYYLVQAPLAWNRDNPSEAPIQVTVHDNFSRGVPDWMERLEDPALTVITRSVLDPLDPNEPPFQHLIHAASIASPIFYRQHPIETMDANVNGLRQLLDHAEARADSDDPLQNFLYFSTSEIYGDPDPASIPTPETYRGSVSCTGPRACYDESKRYGETLCVNFARERNVRVTVARPFNNYGPGLRITDARVLPDFARNVLNNQDIVMLSDGAATRTFCYVRDAIEGYFRVLALGKNGEAYNIGTESPEISVRELADRVTSIGAELFDYSGAIVQKTSDDPEYLTDNPNRRCPIIDKARAEIGYDPEVDIDEGLRRAMIWYYQEGER
jgi:dTDP-glucose 4,6-dehydratase/UDP-glucuronate decarboxylase